MKFPCFVDWFHKGDDVVFQQNDNVNDIAINIEEVFCKRLHALRNRIFQQVLKGLYDTHTKKHLNLLNKDSLWGWMMALREKSIHGARGTVREILDILDILDVLNDNK